MARFPCDLVRFPFAECTSQEVAYEPPGAHTRGAASGPNGVAHRGADPRRTGLRVVGWGCEGSADLPSRSPLRGRASVRQTDRQIV